MGWTKALPARRTSGPSLFRPHGALVLIGLWWLGTAETELGGHGSCVPVGTCEPELASATVSAAIRRATVAGQLQINHLCSAGAPAPLSCDQPWDAGVALGGRARHLHLPRNACDLDLTGHVDRDLDPQRDRDLHRRAPVRRRRSPRVRGGGSPRRTRPPARSGAGGPTGQAASRRKPVSSSPAPSASASAPRPSSAGKTRSTTSISRSE